VRDGAFVVYVRTLGRPDAVGTIEDELHFHLAPDTQEVAAAVVEAAALAELE
jgi:hypothetical protein